MKFSNLALLVSASLPSTFADLCSPDTLLGLGAPTTLPDTFILQARTANGSTLPIVKDNFPLPGGFYLPLSFGRPDISPDDSTVPLFELQAGIVYASGGLVFSTMTTPVLYPQPLYVSADSTQTKETFAAFNATCDGVAKQVLRFSSITPLPIASAAFNGTFAPGTALASPILLDILTLGTSIDLVIVPYNGTF